MERYHAQNCPVSVVQIARSRWTFPLLVELTKGVSSFGKLKKALYPVTSRTLANSIRNAQREQLVSKEGARYKLSQRGKAVLDAVRVLGKGKQKCRGCPGAPICQANSL